LSVMVCVAPPPTPMITAPESVSPALATVVKVPLSAVAVV